MPAWVYNPSWSHRLDNRIKTFHRFPPPWLVKLSKLIYITWVLILNIFSIFFSRYKEINLISPHRVPFPTVSLCGDMDTIGQLLNLLRFCSLHPGSNPLEVGLFHPHWTVGLVTCLTSQWSQQHWLPGNLRPGTGGVPQWHSAHFKPHSYIFAVKCPFL